MSGSLPGSLRGVSKPAISDSLEILIKMPVVDLAAQFELIAAGDAQLLPGNRACTYY